MGLSNLAALVLVKNDSYWLRYALESTKEMFDRYVIYDVGSTDNTRDVIQSFIESEKGSGKDFRVRLLPDCPPEVQGTFRNSMISEAHTDYYFILDGDEIYSKESVEAMMTNFKVFKEAHEEDPRIIYGVVGRIEVSDDLKHRYSEIRTHHRFYHRVAIWKGRHPGEVPFFKQNEQTEFFFPDEALCYHFHSASRSPMDNSTHKRKQRKSKGTYRPGHLKKFDLFGTLPILKRDFGLPINPELKAMRDAAL